MNKESFEQFKQLAYQVEQDTVDYMVKTVLHPEPVRGRYGNWMSFSEALRSFAGYLLQNIECVAKMPNSTPKDAVSDTTDDAQGSSADPKITSSQLADKLKRVEECSNARKAEILRLRETADELAEEVEHLRAWKQSALACTPDWQAISKALNLKLGTSVSDQVLPGILNLLKDRHELVIQLRRQQAYCTRYVRAYQSTARYREVEELLDKHHHSTVEP